MKEQRERAVETPARVNFPGILPLEIWDYPITGGLLGKFIDEPQFPTLLLQALCEIRAGNVTGQERLFCCRDFSAVCFTGGRAGKMAASPSFSALYFPRFVVTADRFSTALLDKLLPGPVLIADVGQTAIKVLYMEQRLDFSRDFSKLPAIGLDDISEEDKQWYRFALRDFIAGSVKQAMAAWQQPSVKSLLLALPAELSEAGIPGSSSYPGLEGDEQLAADAASAAGLPGCRVFFVNDAELAAFAALQDARIVGFDKILVVTLGFGVGAALITRR